MTAASGPVPAPAGDDAATVVMTPFLTLLARQIRAHDTFGAWESRSDASLLAEMIITAEQRRRLPLIADADDKARWRLDVFYGAVGLAIERETGIIAQPIITLSREGFGRMVLVAGRLVAVARTLRDVHRFGFPTAQALAEAGDGLVAEGVAMIRQHPDVAQA